jgi:hypothetical protein
VGLWERIRDALSATWADWLSPSVDEHTRLVTWLTQSCRTEHGLSLQIQQIIPMVPYEQFRLRLEIMARDDEQHASFLQACLDTAGGSLRDALKASAESSNNVPRGPWHRLQQVLTVKRELYEGYRQEVTVVDDAALHSLLERLRDDEAQHQEQLIEMLMQLDAHVHETIT